MLWFTARDTPNGEIEERGHRLDETAPVTKPSDETGRTDEGRPGGGAGDGRGWRSRRVRHSLASFRKRVNSSSSSRGRAIGHNACLSQTARNGPVTLSDEENRDNGSRDGSSGSRYADARRR
jgi:hypothetical protein